MDIKTILKEKGDKFMAVETTLNKKKLGIHMSGLTKVLPWLYPAFAAIFLGLNFAGITTGLGSGILGNLPQGVLLNGNVWQSIANSAFLLAQGTAVGAGVAAVLGAYPAIRNITSYARYKKAEKFNYVKGKKVAGVNYDKEAQKTESIINNMLPSTSIGASRLEQAIKLRQDANEAKGWKKFRLGRKATWQEDVVRRSIVTLTDRLAELTRLENRGWKTYSSATGFLTLSANEIATRKAEMRMIQNYFFSVLNKVDDKDPFATTLIAQVKKYRVDKLNNGTKVAGIHLVPETTDPDAIMTANTINDALVRGDVKKAIISLYNETDNDLRSIKAAPTDAVERAIANINLRRAEDAADLAERAAESATQDAYTAHVKGQELLDYCDQLKLRADAKVKDLDSARATAYVILDTLKNTLMNARNKKQAINKAYKQAMTDLISIGYSKKSADETASQIIDQSVKAEAIITEMKDELVSVKDLHATANKILVKMGNQQKAAKGILRKLNIDILAANGNLATIRRNVVASYDELNEITGNKEQSAILVADIAKQRGTILADVAEILANKERSALLTADTEESNKKAKGFADDTETQFGRAKKFADDTKTKSDKVADILDQAKQKLSNIDLTDKQADKILEDMRKKLEKANISEGIIDGLRKSLEAVLKGVEESAEQSVQRTLVHEKTAEEAKDKTLANAKDTEKAKDETLANAKIVEEAKNKILEYQAKIERINQSVKDIRKNVKNNSTEYKNELNNFRVELTKIVADINGLHSTALSETEGIATLSNDVRQQAKDLIGEIDKKLEQELEKAKTANENINTIMKSINLSFADFSKKYTGFINGYYSFTDYLDSLGKKEKILQDIIDKIESYKTEGKTITKELKDIKEAAKGKLKHITSLDQSAEQIRNRMSQRENTVNQILANINKLYDGLKTAKKAQIKDIEALNSSLQKAVETFNENLQAKIADFNTDIDNFEELKAYVQSTKDDIEKNKQYLKEMTQFYKNYEKIIEELQKSKDATEASKQETLKELGSLQAQFDVLKEDFARYYRNRVTKGSVKRAEKRVEEKFVNMLSLSESNMVEMITEKLSEVQKDLTSKVIAQLEVGVNVKLGLGVTTSVGQTSETTNDSGKTV